MTRDFSPLIERVLAGVRHYAMSARQISKNHFTTVDFLVKIKLGKQNASMQKHKTECKT